MTRFHIVLLFVLVIVLTLWLRPPCREDLPVTLHTMGASLNEPFPNINSFSLRNSDSKVWPRATVTLLGARGKEVHRFKNWKPMRRYDFPKTYPGDEMVIHIRQSWRCRTIYYVSD